MLRHLEVSRLCRPARLRCRPALLYRPKSTSSPPPPDGPSVTWPTATARRLSTALAARPRSSSARKKGEEKIPLAEESSSQMLRRRNEDRDYDQAKQLKEVSARATRTPTPSRKRLLPSLRNPHSFKRGEGSQSAAKRESTSVPIEATESSSSNVMASDPAMGSSPSLTSSTSVDEVHDNTDVPPEQAAPKPPSRKGKERAQEPALRRNPAGVQLLSPSLHKQLFPGKSLPKPPRHLVELSREHLEVNGLRPDGAAVLSEIDMDLPPLRGSNIRDHFLALGKSEAEPYLSLAHGFVDAILPPIPETWATEWAGWTKYHADGTVEAVDGLGEEQTISFDVETLYKISPYPVMATAATPTHWYSWLCPSIFESPPTLPPAPRPRWDKTIDPGLPDSLIPMFQSDQARLVIGHNVGYDRARIKDEYNLDETRTRFLDTLSLHVATRGITSVQRPAWMKHRKTRETKEADAKGLREAAIEAMREVNPEWADMLEAMPEEPEAETQAAESSDDDTGPKWEDVTSMNSLKDVAALHCGYAVDKTVRDRFSDDSITHASQLRPELSDLLQYCADDVRITHDVFKRVFPLFIRSCPHPASFAGALAMGSAILPVNESWKTYLQNAEETYRRMEGNVAENLRSLAEKLRIDGPTAGDVWHEQLDWTPKKPRWSDSGPDAPQAAVHAVEAARKLIDAHRPSEKAMSLPTGTDRRLAIGPATSPLEAEQDPASGNEPRWLEVLTDPTYRPSAAVEALLIPLLLRTTFHGYPVVHLRDYLWCFRVPAADAGRFRERYGDPVTPSSAESVTSDPDFVFFRTTPAGKSRRKKLISAKTKSLLRSELGGASPELLTSAFQDMGTILGQIPQLAEELKNAEDAEPWVSQLEQMFPASKSYESSSPASNLTSPNSDITWPTWYHDLTRPVSQLAPGHLDLSQKKSVAPLLLRLQWDGYPLVLSRRYRWLYRVPQDQITSDMFASDGAVIGHGPAVGWDKGPTTGDEALAADMDHLYFRLPHPGGEGKNVGNPLSKNFVKFLEAGKLASASNGDKMAARIATEATQMSVLCSYWVSARERIMDQLVVYDTPSSGLILPQVITMGTVTRRAVESTWLTASNAKKNRVGSELKAMVRAPPGYALVGADVDSEELWISSVMGDSQFGMHGATAIGWMTLEGTKSAGTDLHSKTASILGTSRDAAKVFNYSRIYGAGVKHAVQLLMQGDPNLTKEAATEKAKALYSATKGEKSNRGKNLGPAAVSSLWHGGSESYLFNTLEAIALSDRPTTPALGCGVTKALSRRYLDSSATYLPSRINWVVQSSGVDYLHLLIVSMSYLIKRYDIQARYLLSVHDEVRYLAKDEDRYRTALALQIANAWTRALFCYNLGIDDVPQGVTFFSAVDIDHVLRKEVNMPCVTPSHPHEIPFGETVDIDQLLAKTPTLGGPTSYEADFVQTREGPPVQLFTDIDSTAHYQFLKAQSERKGLRARIWLDKQPATLNEKGVPIGAKLGRGKGARVERLRESTAHLNGRASLVDIREALIAFEEEVRTGRKLGAD